MLYGEFYNCLWYLLLFRLSGPGKESEEEELTPSHLINESNTVN